MTVKDFVQAVAEKADCTQKDTKKILDAMNEVIPEIVKAQDELKAFKGMTIKGEIKPAHAARNPLNGETVQVPAKVMPKCKFSANFKKTVSGLE